LLLRRPVQPHLDDVPAGGAGGQDAEGLALLRANVPGAGSGVGGRGQGGREAVGGQGLGHAGGFEEGGALGQQADVELGGLAGGPAAFKVPAQGGEVARLIEGGAQDADLVGQLLVVLAGQAPEQGPVEQAGGQEHQEEGAAGVPGGQPYGQGPGSCS